MSEKDVAVKQQDEIRVYAISSDVLCITQKDNGILIRKKNLPDLFKAVSFVKAQMDCEELDEGK